MTDQIVGADGNSFNSNGRVDIDFAQIPREELSAVYTKKGLETYLKGNLPTENNGDIVDERELQAFIDGVRTQEVLVGRRGKKGTIPNSAYDNYSGASSINANVPNLLKEPVDLTIKKEEWKKQLQKGRPLNADSVIGEILTIWNS